MNIAIIDLGTNTFNLFIARVSEGKYQPIYATKDFVQLGKGGINNQIIRDDAIDRGMNTLNRFKKISIEHNCDKTIAIATSAIRNANNGQQFVEKVLHEIGIEIQIIDGNQEAEYIYLGAKQAVKLGNDTSIIMDVGGGSTEFIICNQNKILWKQSFEIGAARLLEEFHTQDPITQNEISKINEHLNSALSPLIEEAKKHRASTLVGCSGAFSSFSAMIQSKDDLEDHINSETTYVFNLSEFEKVHQTIIKSTIEERLKLTGLVKERAPMIVVGTVLVQFILKKLNIKTFEMSKYALKEGVAVRFAKNL